MISWINDLSLFRKIAFGMSVIVLIGVGLSSVASYVYFERIYEKQILGNAVNLVERLNDNLEFNIDQVDRMIALTYSDEDVREAIESKTDGSAVEQLRHQNSMQKFFQRLVTLRQDVNSVYFYISPTKSYSYYTRGAGKIDYDPTDEPWFRETVEANGNIVISKPHHAYQLDRGEEAITFSKVIKNFDGVSLGVLVLDVSISSLNRIVEKANLSPRTTVALFEGDRLFPIDGGAEGTAPVLSEEAAADILKENKGIVTTNISGEKYVLAFHSSKLVNWKIVTLTPYEEVAKDGIRLLKINTGLALIVFLFAVLLSLYFSRLVTRPIMRLHQGMRQLKRGDFGVHLTPASNDELGQLTGHFNDMTSNMKQLIKERYEEQLARKDAEFKYLQMQINPHFIYNTLQIVSSMAAVGNTVGVQEISVKLAKMMRYGIQGSTDLVAFSEEADNVKGYLDIQRVRFRDTFSFELDFDPALSQLKVPKLIFQPIVENSFVHGLQKKDGEGKMRFSARLEAGTILVAIEDNGIGISSERLRELSVLLRSEEESAGSEPDRRAPGEKRALSLRGGIGLSNINQRIRLMYGNEYGIGIQSLEGEWTKVTVRIPAVGGEGGS